jgi:hypothetical protein
MKKGGRDLKVLLCTLLTLYTKKKKKKKIEISLAQWFMPIILAIWAAEIKVQGQTRQTAETPILK